MLVNFICASTNVRIILYKKHTLEISSPKALTAFSIFLTVADEGLLSPVA